MNVARLLRNWRAVEGITLAELASKCELSVSFLSDIERGRTDPSVKTLHKIAAAYGVQLDIRFVPLGGGCIPEGAFICPEKTMNEISDRLHEIAGSLVASGSGAS